MLRIVLNRIPQMIIVVLGIGFLTFSIINILPGDIVTTILGEEGYTEEAAAALRERLRLDDPFLVRYFAWLGDFVTGNLGNSFVPPRQAVGDLILKSMLPTIEMVIIGQIVAIIIGVLLAVVSVVSRNRIVDRAISSFALICDSIPGFVLALLLLLVLSVQWGIVAPNGWASPFTQGWDKNLIHILFPGIVLGLYTFPLTMRVFRAELITQLDDEDYVVLARLKGISGSRIVFGHVLRNSSFGLLTLVGMNFARLVGGAVVTEAIFAIPGIGTLIKDAVIEHDAPVALAAISVVAIMVVIANLLTDLAYAALDPRVRDAAT